MDRKILEKYLHKVVVVRQKNNWKWEGILLRVEDSDFLIDDIIKGKTWISVESIMSVYESENGR